MSKKKKDSIPVEEVVDIQTPVEAEIDIPVEEVPEGVLVEEVIEEPKEIVDIYKNGFVTGCEQLNVRQSPDVKAKPVCIIKLGTSVKVDEKSSTDIFYKVQLLDGTEGFCMKQYIGF